MHIFTSYSKLTFSLTSHETAFVCGNHFLFFSKRVHHRLTVFKKQTNSLSHILTQCKSEHFWLFPVLFYYLSHIFHFIFTSMRVNAIFYFETNALPGISQRLEKRDKKALIEKIERISLVSLTSKKYHCITFYAIKIIIISFQHSNKNMLKNLFKARHKSNIIIINDA